MASLCLLIYTSTPGSRESQQFLMPALNIPISTNITEDHLEISQIPENWEIIITAPKEIWIGNSSQISLILQSVNKETGSFLNLPDYKKIYENFDIFIETRLDVPGLEIFPADSVQEALIEAYDKVFIWEVKPKGAGIFRGNLWIFLNFYPKGEGQFTQIPVIIYPIEIRVVRILGITSIAARYLGVVGAAVGIFLMFSFGNYPAQRLINRIIKNMIKFK